MTVSLCFLAAMPFIENLTPDGAVNAADAIVVLDNFREEDPLGGSPLYDALVYSSQVLSGSDFWNKSKKFYVFTDKDGNHTNQLNVASAQHVEEQEFVISGFTILDIPSQAILS